MQIFYVAVIFLILYSSIWLFFFFYEGKKYIGRKDSKKKSELSLNIPIDKLLLKLHDKLSFKIIYQSPDQKEYLLKVYPSINSYGAFHSLTIDDNKMTIYTFDSRFVYSYYNHVRLTNRLDLILNQA